MIEFIKKLLSEDNKVSAVRLAFLSCVYGSLILFGSGVWMSFAKLDISYVKEVNFTALALISIASGTKLWQKNIEEKKPIQPSVTEVPSITQ